MLILIKSKRFQLDICTLNSIDPAHKTWDNFKDDFRTAYNSLRELDDLTIDQSPVLNYAQLMELTAAQTDNEPSADSLLPQVCQPTCEEQTNNTFEITLLRRFEELATELAVLKHDTGRCTSRSTNMCTPKHYCWSHGCCPHWSKNCDDKKEGHMDDASFKSRTGITLGAE